MNKRTNNGVVSTFIVDNKNQLTNAPGVGTQTFDDNGNVTYSAGNSRGYGYDDENRLVNWYYYDGGYNGNGQPTSPADLRTEFVYDGLGRLRKRVEYAATSNYPYSWVVSSETRYVYDSRLVIQERNGSNTPAVSYTRGVDLSGSFQGAGGIGGLLARSHGYSGGNWSTHNYYQADGGGNVTHMISSAQAMVASHKYDPYGKTLISSGTLAGANVYRFSSKEIHVNSGLYYYGYRFYDPNLQRWLNRDPINDLGFKTITQNRGRFKRGEEKNLYCFVRNSPPTFCDPLGKDLTGTVVGGVFPESWAVSGNDVPGGGWYAVHCAGHCWEQSINKLLNCPLGKGPALLSIHSVAWELIEISSGPGGWGDEPWSDRLTDLFANTYGALLSKQCVGGCQKCESVWDLVAKANSARKCCDSACAAAQPWFLAMAEVMQLITGGR